MQFSDKLTSFLKNSNTLESRMGSIIRPQAEFMIEFLKSHPEIKTILETGFHKGISAAFFLDTRPDIQMVSFDIFWFDYTRKSKLFLDLAFPDRHLLLAGNSITSVPTFFRMNSSYMPDMVFIDGGHEAPVPYMDIYQILKHVKENTWIIIDDYCEAHGSGGVNDAVNWAIKNNLLKDYQAYSAADRGWVVSQRSATPVPDCVFNETQREKMLEDVLSHYP